MRASLGRSVTRSGVRSVAASLLSVGVACSCSGMAWLSFSRSRACSSRISCMLAMNSLTSAASAGSHSR
ncbi:MAG: hypothetical protein IPG81_15560 [Sandaracinaceae bacterium]|nr:hypothetical protein [Sandaracinaceae bacterium]